MSNQDEDIEEADVDGEEILSENDTPLIETPDAPEA
jgi:hypothetical protein